MAISTPVFAPAQRRQSKIRIALTGVAGAGKTYTALQIASGLGDRIALIDTEHGRASKYAHRIAFDVLNLSSFHPQRYVDALTAAAQAQYDVCIIDSLSHAWVGKDGALELVDRATAANRSGNSFTAWKEVTPLHIRLIETICSSPLHIIATLRSKTKYELVEERGKLTPKRMGMEYVQRDGLEYEFDLVGDLDLSHTLTISKSVLETIHPGDTIALPDAAIGHQIRHDLAQDAAALDARAERLEAIRAHFKALRPGERSAAAARYFGRDLAAIATCTLEQLDAGWSAMQQDAPPPPLDWRAGIAAYLPHLTDAQQADIRSILEQADYSDVDGQRLYQRIVSDMAGREAPLPFN